MTKKKKKTEIGMTLINPCKVMDGIHVVRSYLKQS